MKIQVNHQTGALKYTTLVLAGSLLLVVFLNQINNSKTNNPGNYTVHPVATESALLTHVTTTEDAEKTVPTVNSSNEVALVKEIAATTVIEENVEAEVSLANWMVDEDAWNTNNENEVILTSWMVSTDPWTVNNEYQQELVLLEDWMLDTNASWNLAESYLYAEERVEEINLETWMLTVEPWMDYPKPEQLHNIESLLTFFSEK